jgi:CRISPR-associated protein Cas1
MEKDSDIILDRLADLCQLANDAPSPESLLGIEGAAARIYFSGFAQIIKGGDFFKFEDRNRRPPKDPINAVLSFLYSMLAKEWTVTLTSVGFDPMLGFYHKPRYGRPALALDLSEEFRPLIADSVTLSLVNSGELSDNDFVFKAGACSLNEKGRKTTIAAFERRLDSLITHPIFGYKISYRRIFEVQARLLARTLSGELSSYPSFLTR